MAFWMRDHPRPNTDALLEHAGFLRGLARRLLLDDAQADDAVQQTLLVALQSPPARGNLRAWLSGVLRRVALMTRRTEGRMARRQTAGARAEGLPSTSDVAARLEMQRRVVAAVTALNDPYRSVVVARFFDELAPREIARRLGVPVDTVKTRLKRGLQQLRARLDSEVVGGRAAWTATLLPVALPATAATAGTGAALILKGLITMKTVVATGALAAAAVLFLFLRDSSADRDDESRTRAERVVSGAGKEQTDGDVSGAGSDSERASPSVRFHLLGATLHDESGKPIEGVRLSVGEKTLVSDAAGGFSFQHDGAAAEVTVLHPDFVRRTIRVTALRTQVFALSRGIKVELTVRGPDGAPLDDVSVRVVGLRYVLRYNPAGGYGPDHEFQALGSAATGRDGRADLGTLARRPVRVLLDHPRFARTTLGLDPYEGKAVKRDVRLTRGGTLRGRVTAPGGAPVANALVWVRDDRKRAVRTGPRGRYVLPLVEPGGHDVLASADGHGLGVFGGGSGWGEALPVTVTAGETVESIDLELASATVVTGRILDGGEPRAGVYVLAGVSKAAAGRLVDATTGADGRFSCGPLSPQPGASLTVEVMSKNGPTLLSVSRASVGPGTIALGDLKLPKRARVEGRVMLEDGRPAAGALVLMQSDETFGRLRVTAGTDGDFSAAVPAGDVKISAAMQGDPRLLSRPVSFTLKPGAEKGGLELVLHPVRTVQGIVRSANGSPRGMERVDAFEKGGDLASATITWTGQDGRFWFPGLPGEEYTIRVHGRPATERTVRVGDQRDIELVVPRQGVAVTGRVLAPGGKGRIEAVHVTVIRYVLFLPRSSFGRRLQTREGRFEVDVTEPGTYALEIDADGFAPKRTKRFTVKDKGTIDLGDIRLGYAGGIAGQVVNVAGDPVAYARVFLLGSNFEEPLDKPFTSRDGRFSLNGVAPGTYNLFVVSPSHPLLLRQGIAVTENKRVDLKLRLGDPSPLTIRVLDETGRPVRGAKLVYSLPQVPFLNSELASRYEPPGFGRNESDADGVIRKPSMPAGEINLAISAQGFAVAKRAVKLVAAEPKTIEIRLTRR